MELNYDTEASNFRKIDNIEYNPKKLIDIKLYTEKINSEIE
jgi:hypothetical protein